MPRYNILFSLGILQLRLYFHLLTPCSSMPSFNPATSLLPLLFFPFFFLPPLAIARLSRPSFTSHSRSFLFPSLYLFFFWLSLPLLFFYSSPLITYLLPCLYNLSFATLLTSSFPLLAPLHKINLPIERFDQMQMALIVR